jgi:hypothetical protein
MKDKRLLNVQPEYRGTYADYLKELDDRETKGERLISFDDFLWNKAEKRSKLE